MNNITIPFRENTANLFRKIIKKCRNKKLVKENKEEFYFRLNYCFNKIIKNIDDIDNLIETLGEIEEHHGK